jgi:hypothetical protein
LGINTASYRLTVDIVVLYIIFIFSACQMCGVTSHGVTEREKVARETEAKQLRLGSNRVAVAGTRTLALPRRKRFPPNRDNSDALPSSPLLIKQHSDRQSASHHLSQPCRMAPFAGNLSSSNSRDLHARAILGPKLHDRLPDVKVLIVGAGGIGCELRTSHLLHLKALPSRQAILLGWGRLCS